MSQRTVIAVPVGDANGIGPEIAVKAAVRVCKDGLLRAVLVGDHHVLAYYASRAGLTLRAVDGESWLPEMGQDCVDFVDVSALAKDEFVPGQCNAASGAATIAYLRAALTLTRRGLAHGVVGCPHNETAVNASGTLFRGYPALLSELSSAEADSVLLMLVGGGYRIAHVTLHEPVVEAVRRLTVDLVEAAAITTITALKRLGLDPPVLGIFGINPHAGENGLFGSEDECITQPAANRLRAAGYAVKGPLGADRLLAENECDGYLAMFHDQGHIPIKLLARRNGIAYSIGADFLFASVGHGSAPDIAGQGVADCQPLLSTLVAVGRDCRVRV